MKDELRAGQVWLHPDHGHVFVVAVGVHVDKGKVTKKIFVTYRLTNDSNTFWVEELSAFLKTSNKRVR